MKYVSIINDDKENKTLVVEKEDGLISVLRYKIIQDELENDGGWSAMLHPEVVKEHLKTVETPAVSEVSRLKKDHKALVRRVEELEADRDHIAWILDELILQSGNSRGWIENALKDHHRIFPNRQRKTGHKS